MYEIMNRDTFILELYQKGIIKTGDFTLKSGIKSNIYVDLRSLIAYPSLMAQVIEMIYQKTQGTQYSQICGCAYTGIPIATGISLKYGVPMVLKRKEKKDYGTKKMLEGIFRSGEKCLLIDDVITSGSSLKENIEELEKEGLEIVKICVLIDRRTGEDVLENKYPIESVFTLKEIMDIREKYHYHSKIANQIVQLITKKETNLVLSADVTTKNELIKLADELGPYICILKTHIDIITDFDWEMMAMLKRLSQKHGFFILEDRKFADIGNTVQQQLYGGFYSIAQWADLITVHGLMGSGILEGIKNVGPKQRIPGVLLLAQASSQNNLISNDYTQEIVNMAEQYPELVVGFISQQKLHPKFLHFTPGINLSTEGDGMGQQYNSPEYVIGEKGSDLMIVGRGIYQAENPIEMAQKYREIGWKCYSQRNQPQPPPKVI